LLDVMTAGRKPPVERELVRDAYREEHKMLGADTLGL
jgi:hypothetical protein